MSQLFCNMPWIVATELIECDSQHAPEYCLKKRSQGFRKFEHVEERADVIASPLRFFILQARFET